MYKQMLRNAKLQIGNKGQKTELTGRRPLKRRRSALDCRAIEEEEDDDDDDDDKSGALME